MKVLVTGSSGFFGASLVKKLMLDSYDVALFQRNKLEPILGTKNFQGDIIDVASVNHAIKKLQPDIIYHLAAQSSPKYSWDDPKSTMQTNIEGTINILNSIKSYSSHSKLVMVSSSAVYGEHPLGSALIETDILNPVSPYGLSKLSAEIICQLYIKQFGIQCVIVRPFFIIGPYKTGDVCSEWAKQIVRIENGSNEHLKVGNLDVVRDFMHISDAVNALIMVGDNGLTDQVFNISTARGVSLRSVLEAYLNLSNSKVHVKEKYRQPNLNEELVKIGANERIKSLGWSEILNYKTALNDILEHWRLEFKK